MIDETHLTELRALLGDDGFQDLWAMIGTDLDHAQARLDQALKTGDLGGLAEASHVLVPLTATAGAAGLSAQARLLQTLARSGDAAALTLGRAISGRLTGLASQMPQALLP